MREIFVLFICLFILVSFDKSEKSELARNTEDFVTVDATSLNTSLAEAINIESAEDIIKMYYGKTVDYAEESENITIKSAKQDEKITVVTLIHNNLFDESIRTMKIVMMVIHIQNTWRVINIRQNWRCYANRGDTNWTLNPCG